MRWIFASGRARQRGARTVWVFGYAVMELNRGTRHVARQLRGVPPMRRRVDKIGERHTRTVVDTDFTCENLNAARPQTAHVCTATAAAVGVFRYLCRYYRLPSATLTTIKFAPTRRRHHTATNL